MLRPTTTSTIARALLAGQRAPIRAYATSGPTGGDMGHDKTHAVDKKDQHDVQSKASGQARREKAGGDSGSSAINESDETNSNARAKKDTKAPGPVIGMNDERGGKGA